MNVKITESKLKRITKILPSSEFKDTDSFVAHAIELLLFAEENKEKFRSMVDRS